MAKELCARRTLLLGVEGNDVVDVRLDYTLACGDCGQETSKSLEIEDCNPGQITAIKSLMSAMVRKVEQAESI